MVSEDGGTTITATDTTEDTDTDTMDMDMADKVKVIQEELSKYVSLLILSIPTQ